MKLSGKITLMVLAGSLFWLLLLTPACSLYREAEKVKYSVDHSAADVGEGKRMTMLVCGPCHFNQAAGDLSGGRMYDVPGFVGKVYAANITSHQEQGIGRYTDAELAYLMRTGIARDGKLMPYMQRPNMADEDLRNIIAFLRSDDALVKASDKVPGETRYTPVGKMGISQSEVIPWKDTLIVKPEVKNQLAMGRYLVDNLSCYDCHSKSFMSIDKMEPEQSKGYMGGGNKLKNKSGETVLSSNLTPHSTGIADWTEADLNRALRQGVSKNNSVITFPMPMYSELTDEEISAIYLYLKSLPPIENKIRKS